MKKSKLDKLTEALAEAGYEMRQFKAYSEGRSIDLTIDLIEAQDDSNGLKPQKDWSNVADDTVEPVVGTGVYREGIMSDAVIANEPAAYCVKEDGKAGLPLRY